MSAAEGAALVVEARRLVEVRLAEVEAEAATLRRAFDLISGANTQAEPHRQHGVVAQQEPRPRPKPKALAPLSPEAA